MKEMEQLLNYTNNIIKRIDEGKSSYYELEYNIKVINNYAKNIIKENKKTVDKYQTVWYNEITR